MRVTGFGGQGIILAGFMIGKAASLHDKKHATMVQAYGPEARGSSCSSQLIVDSNPILNPYPHTQDVLLALSQEGYDKFVPTLREDGILLYDEDLVELDPQLNIRVVKSVPATRIAEELGRVMVANVVMLGFFAAQTDVVSTEAMRDAILSSVPKGTSVLNTNAFERGFEHVPVESTVAVGV